MKISTRKSRISPNIMVANPQPALRARLTKQGALDNMKSQLRNNKTIDWLYSNARIETATKSEA